MLSSDKLSEVGAYLKNAPDKTCVPVFRVPTYQIKRVVESPKVKKLLRQLIEMGYTPYVQNSSVPSGHDVGFRIWVEHRPIEDKDRIAVRTYYNGLLGHIMLDHEDSAKDRYVPLPE